MGKRESLVGKRFGRLYVIEYDHSDSRGATYWRCKCDCGNETVVIYSSLSRGTTMSCGCKRHDRRVKDLTGRRFGRLTVLSYDHSDSHGHPFWVCECDCGNEVVVEASHLTMGHTTSCGCYRRDTARETKTTHGMSNSSLYNIWCGMLARCNNPNNNRYDIYGDRGISVCAEWSDFETFRDWALNNGYKEGLSIDRIDNDNGYYPENCRWADQITQQNNKRSNNYVTWCGETHTVAEWARLFNVGYTTLWYRIRNNNMRDFEEYFANK